jgi:hypothetical protein
MKPCHCPIQTRIIDARYKHGHDGEATRTYVDRNGQMYDVCDECWRMLVLWGL